MQQLTLEGVGQDLHDEPFMTVKEKRRVLRDWDRFLRNGLREQDFTEVLYKHLSLHCAFIAHYDRSGFYGTYFTTGDGVLRFLSQFDRRRTREGEEGPRSCEIVGTYWIRGQYADINQAMVDIAGRYIPELTDAATQQQKLHDLARASELARRWSWKVCESD